MPQGKVTPVPDDGLVEKLDYVVKMARQYEAAVMRVPEAVHGAGERLEQAKRELLAASDRDVLVAENERLKAENARLRDPSPEMIQAGIDALDACVDYDWDSGSDGESHNEYVSIRSDAAATVYRAMVAALVSLGGEGGGEGQGASP